MAGEARVRFLPFREQTPLRRVIWRTACSGWRRIFAARRRSISLSFFPIPNHERKGCPDDPDGAPEDGSVIRSW